MSQIIKGLDSSCIDTKSFEKYKQMIEIEKGVTLSQICNMTKLEPHIIQNWVKRGYMPHPINKKYFTKHIARILLINALRECMYIDDIGFLMVYINGDVDDESDDIISEEDLFKLFSNLVYEIKDLNKIDETINKNVKIEKLNKCMKIMIYAFFAGEMSKRAQHYLKDIK